MVDPDDDKKEKKERKSPAKVSRKRFAKIKKAEPKRAERIEARVSGEIYGLYPTPYGYASDIVVDVVFVEGKYKYGLD